MGNANPLLVRPTRRGMCAVATALASAAQEFEQSSPFLFVQLPVFVFVEQVEDRGDALPLLWCHFGRQIFQSHIFTEDGLQVLHRELLLKTLHVTWRRQHDAKKRHGHLVFSLFTPSHAYRRMRGIARIVLG